MMTAFGSFSPSPHRQFNSKGGPSWDDRFALVFWALALVVVQPDGSATDCWGVGGGVGDTWLSVSIN